MTVGPVDDPTVAAGALRVHGAGAATIDREARVIGLPVVRTPGLVARVVRDLDDARIEVVDIEVRRPTLDDVFLTLTGHRAEHRSPLDGPKEAVRVTQQITSRPLPVERPRHRLGGSSIR